VKRRVKSPAGVRGESRGAAADLAERTPAAATIGT
jgi:hypothetical protein